MQPPSSRTRLAQGATVNRLLPRIERRHVLMALPGVLLFLTPLVLWTGLFGNHMNISGDDSLLYYLEPWQWASHSSVSLLDQGFLGFNPRTYFVPFVASLEVPHALGLNAQGLAFGALSAATYAGIARLVVEFAGTKSPQALAGGALGGFTAATAPLVFGAQQHYLTAIYWQALLPWLLLFVIWHQKTGNWRWIAAAAALTMYLAPAINQSAWTIATAPLFVMLFATAALTRRWKFSPGRLLLLGVFVLGCNAYWLVPMTGLSSQGNDQLANATSVNGKAVAAQIVDALAPFQSPADSLALRQGTEFLKQFSPAGAEINDWSRQIGVLGDIPAAFIFFALALSFREKFASSQRWLLYGLTAIAMIQLFFVTVNVLPFGPSLFTWVLQNVPLATAVRNFYDKFAIAYVASIAIAAGYAFWTVFKSSPARKTVIVAGSCMALLAFHAAPHLGGAEFRAKHRSGSVDRVRNQDGLAPDYAAMLKGLQALPNGAVLSLPLSTPAWSIVPHEDSKGTYLGISPIFYLTGRTEYNGYDSFASVANPSLQPRVQAAVTTQNVDEMASIIRITGIRYVITSTDRSSESNPITYSTSLVSDIATENQYTDLFVSRLAPTVIAQYGRFQIREVIPEVATGRVTLTRAGDPEESCGGPVRITKETLTSVKVVAPPTDWSCDLVLRNPYSDGWIASWKADSTAGRLTSQRTLDASNLFNIPPHAEPAEITLSYGPQSLVKRGVMLTILWLGILAAGAYLRLRKQRISGGESLWLNRSSSDEQRGRDDTTERNVETQTPVEQRV